MVAGYHLIWTVYGYWLPNDPRGSSSEAIGVGRLSELGELHYGREKVQPPSRELREFFAESRDVLAHRVYEMTDEEIGIVAAAFGTVIGERKYVCHACSIVPDHVHMVIRRPVDFAEVVIRRLQEASKAALIAAGRRPKPHPVWGGPGWKVFLRAYPKTP